MIDSAGPTNHITNNLDHRSASSTDAFEPDTTSIGGDLMELRSNSDNQDPRVFDTGTVPLSSKHRRPTRNNLVPKHIIGEEVHNGLGYVGV